MAVTANLLALASALSGQTVSFLPPTVVAAPAGGGGSNFCPKCLAVADFNGDGIPDVVFSGHVQTPFAQVLLGNGDGTFRSGSSFDITHFAPVTQVATGDFDGDGKQDLVFFAAVAMVYRGSGDGTFEVSPNHPPFSVQACSYDLTFNGALAFTDVNRDGKADLICGSSVLLSAGDGTFTAAANLPGSIISLADLNRDGVPDALVLTSAGTIAAAPGRGDGTFGAASPVANSLGVASTLVADFNGDGNPDIAAATPAGTLTVLPGNGGGTFGPPASSLTLPGILFTAADFNGDGKVDLLAGEAVLLGNGDGTFRFPVFVGISARPCGTADAARSNCTIRHSASVAADLNRDGLPDIVSAFAAYDPFSGNLAQARVGVNLNDSPGDGFTVTGISAATGQWPVGVGSIVSAYGVNLAPRTEAAATNPAPTELAGIRLHAFNISTGLDTLAPLLYVSPTQINYVLPFSHNFELITIERVGTPYIAKGMGVPIATAAPGLFAFGNGLAAATALRLSPFGYSTLPVVNCLGPICSAVPIDVSGGSTYLSLYGTGFDETPLPSGVTCSLAGQTLAATYAGPEKVIAGLDQINILLPASLAGTGLTQLSCSFGIGLDTNSVLVSIH